MSHGGSVLALGKELMNGKYILKQALFWCDMAQVPGLLCSCADLHQVRILPSWDKYPLHVLVLYVADVLQGGLRANPGLLQSPGISSEEGKCWNMNPILGFAENPTCS